MAAGAGAIAGGPHDMFAAFVSSLIPGVEEKENLKSTFEGVKEFLKSDEAQATVGLLGAGVNIAKVAWVGSSSQERDTAIAGESDLDCALVLSGLPERVDERYARSALLSLAKYLVGKLFSPGIVDLFEKAEIIRLQTTSVGILLAEKKELVSALVRDIHIPLVDIDLVLHTNKSGNDMVVATDGTCVGTIATLHAICWKSQLDKVQELKREQMKHVARVLKSFCKEKLYLEADDSHAPLWPSYVVEAMLMLFAWAEVNSASDVYNGCVAAVTRLEIAAIVAPCKKPDLSKSPMVAPAVSRLEAKWKRQNIVGIQTNAISVMSSRIRRLCKKEIVRTISVANFKQWAKTKASSVR